MKYILYTDGGSRGNPGPAALGVVICRPADDHPNGDNGELEIVKRYSESLGETTNNEAEYQALIFGLKKLKQVFGKEKMKQAHLEVRMDSELIVNQLNHEYKIEEPKLQKLFLQVWNLMLDFGPMKFVAIPREENKEADRLVNEALDKKQGKLL
ncbi:ribonuclease HI family protein [Patescibacteria group bacterium]|nr:ribonuclease HI family protein [Patescibacteria group bacterium]